MLSGLFVLLVSAAAWIAILWLAVFPRFAAWSNPAVIALHALPPLVVWLGWVVIRRRSRRRKEQEAQARDQQLQAERDAAREAARKKHDELVQQRRFGCDCRAVTIAGLALNSELPLLDVDADNIEVRSRPVDEARTSPTDSALDRLAPAIHDALASLYGSCTAALALPVFVLPPADVSGEETFATLRSVWRDIAAEAGMQDDFGPDAPIVRFLPSSDSAANSAIALFEAAPDLPGAIVLAFDSPLARMPDQDSDDDIDPALRERMRRAGQPSEGVVALLLTNPQLDAMLAALDDIELDNTVPDSMTPYWQRSMQAEGYLATLARVDRGMRAGLGRLPVLGRIRRAVFGSAPAAPAGVLDMTRAMQESLEHAQINAGMIDMPFTHDIAESPSSAPTVAAEAFVPSAPNRCRWLIHNAGAVDYAGKRLAALGSAMYYFGIDLNPVDIDMSTNLATRVGDLGRATGVGQLALGIAHAANTRAPSLCAEFADCGGVAVGFVTPGNATA